MLTQFVPHDSHHVIGYEDRVHGVFVEAGHLHLQINLPANVQGEHNPRNAKRKTVPTSGNSLRGSRENYEGILGPCDQNTQTDMLRKRALTAQPRSESLSVGIELDQWTSFFTFP